MTCRPQFKQMVLPQSQQVQKDKYKSKFKLRNGKRVLVGTAGVVVSLILLNIQGISRCR